MVELPGGEFQTVQQGTGHVEITPGRIRLLRPSARVDEYTNAEISDPSGPRRWRPPVIMSVRARFSHPVSSLRGTAGFGFWNAGIGPGVRIPRPPRAVWYFFGGLPHNVPLAMGVSGSGFKAAVLDTQRAAFYALLPTAPFGVLLMRIPAVYRRLWPIAQRAIGASEACLDDLDVTMSHVYTIRWQINTVTFEVDGRSVLKTASAPGGPLGFVAWIDNSYAIATPQGHFELGLVSADEAQWLDLEDIQLTQL